MVGTWRGTTFCPPDMPSYYETAFQNYPLTIHIRLWDGVRWWNQKRPASKDWSQKSIFGTDLPGFWRHLDKPLEQYPTTNWVIVP